jgi:hypothetical protein
LLPQNYYILLLLPLGLLLFSNRIPRSFRIAVFVAGLGVCVYAQLRGMLLAYSASYAILTISKKWLKKWLIPVIIACAALCAALFHYKADSARGRLLIWKITCTYNNQWLWGNGPQSFQENYPAMQHDYFREQSGTITEQLLAGMPQFAFNEYLQFAYEYGLLALIMAVATLLFLLFLFIKYTRNRYLRCTLLFALYIILLAASFTYLFHYELLALVAATIVILMMLSCILSSGFRWQKPVFGVTSSLLFIITFFYWRSSIKHQQQENRAVFEAITQLPACREINGKIILNYYTQNPRKNENKMHAFRYYISIGDTIAALHFADSLINRKKYYYPLLMAAANVLDAKKVIQKHYHCLKKATFSYPGFLNPSIKSCCSTKKWAILKMPVLLRCKS